MADRAPLLWAETFFVLGLRYPPDVAGQLLQGVRGMRDSLTYQAVLEEGRAEGEARGRAEGRLEEARRLLRQLGERQFGPPDSAVGARIERLTEVEQVERATFRLLEAASWEDALSETHSG
jgi:predicted transposase YdaD